MTPYAPLKPCPHPGCPVLGECPTHGRRVQRQRYDRARAFSERAMFYRSPEWKAIRLAVLERDPVCTWGSLPADRASAPCPSPSTDCAHITPWPAGDDSFENLRGLCHRHHSSETSRGESWRNRGRGV